MPSFHPSTTPAQSSSQSSSLPPLVADVPQSRTCWICLDTDEDERQSGQPKEWTHACDCSLLAHEDVSRAWSGIGPDQVLIMFYSSAVLA